jgi:hypothetical protein
VNVVDTTHDGSFGDVCPQIPVFMEAVPGWNTGPIRGVVHASCTGFTPWAEARDHVGLVLAPKVGTGPDAHQAPLGPPPHARLQARGGATRSSSVYAPVVPGAGSTAR